jgi:hypothetical protein
MGGPANGIEYGDGVEVVAPVCDLTVLDRDARDEVVVVGLASADRPAVNCVFEDGNRGFAVPVNGQFIGAVQDDRFP